MKKAVAGAGALVLAGVGSVALAGASGAQSVEEVPSYPGTPLEVENSGGYQGVVELDRPGFTHAAFQPGSDGPTCTLGDNEILAGVDIDIWQFDEDGEPQLLDEGYALSDAEFWGGDVTEYVDEAELDRFTVESSIHGAFSHTGAISIVFEPPASSGEQIFVATCMVVDADATMEGSVDDLERSDEAFVGTYTVDTGSGDGGAGDGDSGGDGEGEGGGDDSDDATTPAPTPVSGDPGLTG